MHCNGSLNRSQYLQTNIASVVTGIMTVWVFPSKGLWSTTTTTKGWLQNEHIVWTPRKHKIQWYLYHKNLGQCQLKYIFFLLSDTTFKTESKIWPLSGFIFQPASAQLELPITKTRYNTSLRIYPEEKLF